MGQQSDGSATSQVADPRSKYCNRGERSRVKMFHHIDTAILVGITLAAQNLPVTSPAPIAIISIGGRF